MNDRISKALKHLQLGELQLANILLDSVLSQDKKNFQALYLTGVIEAKNNNYHKAVNLFQKALSVNPSSINALYNLALMYQNLKNWDSALNAYENLIKINPNDYIALNNRGNVLREIDRLDDALNSYAKAISINGEYLQAIYNFGVLLHEVKSYASAEDAYNRILQSDPFHTSALYSRGNLKRDLERFDEAIFDYQSAIEINPQYIEAHNNLGNCFYRTARYSEAELSYTKAIDINPNYADSYNNRGVVRHAMGHYSEAIADYNTAIKLKPDYAEAFYNLSLTFLFINEFEKGWDCYEWRLKSKIAGYTEVKQYSRWNYGSSSEPLLIFGEQGLGDEILFSSILHELIELPQPIFVAVDKRLITLLKRSFPNFNFIDQKEVSYSDWNGEVLPMGSLPLKYRKNISDFAKVKSPYLVSYNKLTSLYRSKITKSKKILCGISWLSSAGNTGSEKSISLSALVKPFKDMSIEFLDLQYGDTYLERMSVFDSEGVGIKHYDEVDNMNDLDKLASLIDLCDLVITISNTTAHLAGALNKDTYLLLPEGRGRLWYWANNCNKNLWYPSVKQFPQSIKNDWESPLSSIKEAIKGLSYAK